jgi:acetylglutamate kinase
MIRVIKIGGRAQSSPLLTDTIASAWNEAPGSFCVVHGGGDEISAWQRRLASEPSFADGRRVTTREDMDLVRMVLSGLVNKRLVSGLVAAGVPAVGLSGEDAGLISATPIDPRGTDRAGRPVAVNSSLLRTLLTGGYLPVISPLAADSGGAEGEALNVNGDDAAAAIAVSLGASELVLIADVSGVLDDSGQPISSIDQVGVADLMRSGVAKGGMRVKLEAGLAALAGGVARVRVASLEGIKDESTGTLLEPTQSLVT